MNNRRYKNVGRVYEVSRPLKMVDTCYVFAKSKTEAIKKAKRDESCRTTSMLPSQDGSWDAIFVSAGKTYTATETDEEVDFGVYD